jgi:hypothetical protein
LRAVARGIALLLLGALPACSSMSVAPETAPAAGPDPAYLNKIAVRFKTQFKTKPPTNGLELSQPRWLLSNNGWSWLVCMRFQDQGYRRGYVMYFDNKEILDNRYAVLSDGCDTQTYTPFDLETAKLVPQATGTQGPVY